MTGWTLRNFGIFILSTSILMLQVTYTRIFSISLWYHFIWMIVSISLLGYGASGTFLSIFKNIDVYNIDFLLTLTSAFFSVSVLFSYILSNYIPFDPYTLAWNSYQLLYIIAYYVLLTIPFFLGGLTLALAIKKSGNFINKVYFSSLFGSAIGAVVVLPLFSFFTGTGVIIFVSVISGLASLSFSLNNNKQHLNKLVGWLILLFIFLPFSGVVIPIRISPYKNLNLALKYPNSSIVETKWNSFSRVDVVNSGFIRYAPGLSLQYDDLLPEQIGVIIDGDEINAITNYDGNPKSLIFTKYLPTALPYQLIKNPKVLIIDAGGGLSVLTALFHNSSLIDAVEENSIVLDLVTKKYVSFSGSIYQNDKVRTTISDGRSYIQSSKDNFDIIELTMTGDTLPSSTGIYALSENYLYTVESFKSSIMHLSEKGILSVSRWLLPPPREDVRIVSLAIAALESLGIENPEKHIAVIRSWATINLVVGKSELDGDEIKSIKLFCKENGFDVVYYPGITASDVNHFNKFPKPFYYNIVINQLNTSNRVSFYNSYLYNIKPCNDERPFFFNFFKWDRIAETFKSLDNKWQPLIEGGLLVPIVLLQATLLTIILVLLPLYRFNYINYNKGSILLLYFFLIGIGYMFIEMTAIQRFILVLGNSIYSISIVIFSLLLSSGLGSYFSERLAAGDWSHKFIITLLSLLLIIYGFASIQIHYLLSLPFNERLLITLILVTPIGFLMGMQFPLGIKLLSKVNNDLITWAWAVNGCASVLGSIAPIIIALNIGFSKLFIISGLIYLATLIPIFLSENYYKN